MAQNFGSSKGPYVILGVGAGNSVVFPTAGSYNVRDSLTQAALGTVNVSATGTWSFTHATSEQIEIEYPAGTWNGPYLSYEAQQAAAILSWNDLTSKPSTFPPAGHTHTAPDLSGVVKTVNSVAPDGAGNVVVSGAGLDTEAVQDAVAAFTVAGTGITKTYNDAANTLTLAVTVGTTAGTIAAGDDTRIVGAEQVANKGANNGYAGLGGSGYHKYAELLPGSQLCVYQGSGGTWPARPTARTDITVEWIGYPDLSTLPSAAVAGVDKYLKRIL